MNKLWHNSNVYFLMNLHSWTFLIDCHGRLYLFLEEAYAMCVFFLWSTEHQNYFGIDNILGPVALSLRREKLESPENPLSDNGKDSTARYLYRIILRTSEVRLLVLFGQRF